MDTKIILLIAAFVIVVIYVWIDGNRKHKARI